MTTTNQRLAADLLASAYALRQVRNRLCRLVHRGHDAAIQSETTVVLIDGHNVVIALEALAERLAREE